MRHKNIHALLIEDSPVDAKVIKNQLAQQGSLVVDLSCRESIAEGLKRLANQDIDVILLDLNLPDGQGLDSFVKIHERAEDVPVIVLTSMDDEETGLDALKMGAQDFLIKGSFDYHFLFKTIRYALERSELRRKIEQMSEIDPLTSLMNRRGLQRVLDREVAWIRRGFETVSVLVDLDDFKRINDGYGHSSGDMVLKEVASRLRSVLRSTDYIARIGGDEFMVFLPQTRLAEARLVAEKLRQVLVSNEISFLKSSLKVTASMGVSAVTRETATIDDLLVITHHALAASKRTGKNRVIVSSGADYEVEEGYELSDVIEMMKHQESYRTVKQPIVALPDRKVIAYEILSRFCMDVFKEPVDFLRMAHEHEMLHQVDKLCLQNGLEAMRNFPKGLRYHLNLFPETLRLMDVAAFIQEHVEGLSEGQSICIELSEQQIIGEPGNLVEKVQALKASGICVAMDEVGFGQSSLESLIVLEPDIVKLGRKCVMGIAADEGKRRTLARLLKVLKGIGSEIIALGIETPEDLEIICDFGISYAQGFLLGKPE
ncbi:MAG: diguanylate cyclase [Candidatus Omnitrophica bacterium]|nr:diguanylate cyclase [Candidatus Omnitrophota bacterium]